MVKVFISHSIQDREIVERRLVSLLHGHGIGTWYCQHAMRPGEGINESVKEGLQSCEWFMVVLSPRAVQSKWVARELSWALVERKGHILPVLIEECRAVDLDPELEPLLHADFTRQDFEEVRKLLRTWGIEASPHEGDFSEEALFQEEHLASRLKDHTVSQELISQLIQYAEGESREPLLVQGLPGSGKSALLAAFCAAYRSKHPESLVLPYFIDSRPSCRNPTALLKRFCYALQYRFDTVSHLSEATQGLDAALRRSLQGIPETEKVVLVIDALHQIDHDHSPLNLSWLPEELPEHVKVVMSCNADQETGQQALAAFARRSVSRLELDGFSQESIAFDFVGHGSRAPSDLEKSDRLYLDVGNALRSGAIDSHQASMARSTASLVMDHPHFLRDAINPWRSRDEPFTIVLHYDPDLDSLASTWLAIAYLTEGKFPVTARPLCNYVDRVDQGHPGLTAENPYTLYAAHFMIGHRLNRSDLSLEERCQSWIDRSLRLTDYVLEQMRAEQRSLLEIDAFCCPVLDREDRDNLDRDYRRYRDKLAAPSTEARRMTLRLPGAMGGSKEVPGLLVRDVMNPDDPDRCVLFKDWARTDTELAPNGFVATSIFTSRSSTGTARCILSVRPGEDVTLEGLGVLLEAAEARKRQGEGGDARLYNPRTGARLPNRVGYQNPDPWYDGRAHGFTIVDSPRSGTVLTPDEIEEVLLHFAVGTGV